MCSEWIHTILQILQMANESMYDVSCLDGCCTHVYAQGMAGSKIFKFSRGSGGGAQAQTVAPMKNTQGLNAVKHRALKGINLAGSQGPRSLGPNWSVFLKTRHDEHYLFVSLFKKIGQHYHCWVFDVLFAGLTEARRHKPVALCILDLRRTLILAEVVQKDLPQKIYHH